MDCNKENDNEKDAIDGFRFHQQLEVAREDIAKLYHLADTKVYRTFVKSPMGIIDITPQVLREDEEGALIQPGLTQEQYDALNKSQKRDYMSDRSLSVNVSKEVAIESAIKSYNSVVAKFGHEVADVFMEEQRGTYVGRIVLKPHQALITKFSKSGHADVILNAEVKPEDIEVFDELTKFDYKKDE